MYRRCFIWMQRKIGSRFRAAHTSNWIRLILTHNAESRVRDEGLCPCPWIRSLTYIVRPNVQLRTFRMYGSRSIGLRSSVIDSSFIQTNWLQKARAIRTNILWQRWKWNDTAQACTFTQNSFNYLFIFLLKKIHFEWEHTPKYICNLSH